MSRRPTRRLITKTAPKKSTRKLAPRETDTEVSAADVRGNFGLSREKFARLTGSSVRALATWESGQLQPNESARLRLAELDRLQRSLATVLRSESISAWLDKPNRAFDGLKPLEVIERGQVDRLWRMIFALESGQPL